jgi:gluconate 2-dehydrogenase alpha chain
MAEQLKKTDVALIGLGASGGIAAFALANAGIHVVGIEAGGRLTGRDEKLNELAQTGRLNVFGRPKANLEIPMWSPNTSTPSIPGSAGTFPTPMMNAVGGTSIHYGTESWRLNPWNFRMRSETIKRYGAGAIPKGSTVADWPITYDDLEPYYDKVEYEIGISGKIGRAHV